MDAKVFDREGKETKTVKLPESIFGLQWNADLVHQVMVSQQSNKRAGTAHTKDRSEVRGGGKKPWRQKGTGRARHGSRRSPIWRGGGITFGPRVEKDYDKKINKKANTKAFYTALSKKFADGEVIFVDALSFEKPATTDAKAFLKNLEGAGFEKISTKQKNAAFIGFPEYDANAVQSFKNITPVDTDEVRNMNLLDLLSTKYVVLVDPEASIAELKKRSKAKVS